MGDETTTTTTTGEEEDGSTMAQDGDDAEQQQQQALLLAQQQQRQADEIIALGRALIEAVRLRTSSSSSRSRSGLASVRTLIEEQGAPTWYQDEAQGGWGALHFAAASAVGGGGGEEEEEDGEEDVVRVLLEQGAVWNAGECKQRSVCTKTRSDGGGRVGGNCGPERKANGLERREERKNEPKNGWPPSYLGERLGEDT